MDTVDLEDTQRIEVDPRRRLLVLDGPGPHLAPVLAALSGPRTTVKHHDGLEGLDRVLTDFWPSVVFIGDAFPTRSGRQVALSLRASGTTFELPLVGLVPHRGLTEVLRWLSVGAVDVWRAPLEADAAGRADALARECASTAIHTEAVGTRLLAYARRAVLSGTVTVYPDTPFEGRASFHDGTLVEAYLGAARGEAAVEQMLELHDAPATWVDARSRTEPTPLTSAPGRPTRVLVVEDVEVTRAMVKHTLEGAGYEVELAADGPAGLSAALKRDHDVLITDLDLPGLDGWGLMRELREDPVARESAVVVLSAHNEAVETLKAARAGARAYLVKPSRPKEILDVVAQLARPRAVAWLGLTGGQRTAVDLRALGPVWLLRSLAELDVVGRLVVEDELSHLEVAVRHGQLMSALAQVGSRSVRGPAAVEQLIGSRAQGTFTPEQLLSEPGAPWVFDVLNEACVTVAAAWRRRVERAVESPRSLVVSQELALLFARVASAPQLKVLDGVMAGAESFADLVKVVGQPPDEVRECLLELVRRGVLSTERPSPA